MVDRSSRPHRSPTRTERLIIKVRVIGRWVRIGSATCSDCTPPRCTGVLTRYRLPKLRWLDRPTGAAIRWMEPEDLIYVDVKNLGKIPK